jgi:predicted Rossmann fold nucleotide-binding protein DprA/Smf involved in DNA uptake
VTERVAIVGAREASLVTLEKVREYVRGLPEGTIVVSGGAMGVDTVAAESARARGLDTVEYIVESHSTHFATLSVFCVVNGVRPRDPFWTFYPEEKWATALLFRNTLIMGDASRAVAFAQGSKGGTWDAVKQAERFKRPVEVVR